MMADNLQERVEQFRTLQLPGQPMSMHMGTAYLVNDLWREVIRLRAENAMLKAEGRLDDIADAKREARFGVGL